MRTLIAIYFYGQGDPLYRNFNLKRKCAMMLTLGGIFILLLLTFWFMGEKVQIQIAELSTTLPIESTAKERGIRHTHPLSQNIQQQTNGLSKE